MKNIEIAERLTAIETNTSNIVNIIGQIREDRKEHLDKCHKQVRTFEKNINANSIFRKTICAIIGSGTFLSLIVLGIWKVIE